MNNSFSTQNHAFSEPAPSDGTDAFRTASTSANPNTTADDHGYPPRRGRPSDYSPATVGMLRGIIRELGLSDSAAAERIGLHKSTISRWKREHPEMQLFLKQAREECRALHLMKIIESSQAENGKGWRASAWLLERLFPEDYAPSATQRERFRNLAERRLEREEAELQEAARAERNRQATAAAWPSHAAEAAEPSEPAPETPETPETPATDANSDVTTGPRNVARLAAPHWTAYARELENSETLSESELQNSRNGVAAYPASASVFTDEAP